MTKTNHQTNLSAVHLRKHMRMQRRSLSHCERQRSAYLATRFLYKLIPLLPKEANIGFIWMDFVNYQPPPLPNFVKT